MGIYINQDEVSYTLNIVNIAKLAYLKRIISGQNEKLFNWSSADNWKKLIGVRKGEFLFNEFHQYGVVFYLPY